MASAKSLVILISALQILSLCHCAPKKLKIPDWITICHRTDPNLIDCLKNAFNTVLPKLAEGIPELGIPKSEPFQVDAVNVDLGTFKASFKNVKIYNATHAKLAKNVIDYPKLTGGMTLNFPELFFEGDYEVGGKLLLLEMNGKGHGSCTISNVDAIIDWVGNRVTKKGKVYLAMGEQSSLDVKVGHVQFMFGDLFKDNPQLEQITNQIINDNLAEFTEEIKPVALGIVKGLTFGIVNQVFQTFTEDELFPQ